MADKREIAWQAVSLGGGALAGLATRRVMTAVWRLVAGHEPPDNPADRGTSWVEAVSWAVAVGVAVGVARLVATRASSAAWETATGTPPPGVQKG